MSQDVWSTSWSRRRLLARGTAGLGLLALAGCGFRPLYAPGGASSGEEASVAQELAAVRVGLIPERFGQLLRRSLQQRLSIGTGGDIPAGRYELQVSPVLQTEGVGIGRDGTATRVRYIATANWALVQTGTPPQQLMQGAERAIEAFNIPINQFFAADASRDAAEGRLTEVLAEGIVQRVALEFRRRHGLA